MTEKCRFFLLDLNELQSQSRSTIRLWGLDEEGKRILIDGTQIEPYFYYLPKEEVDIASTRDKLLESRTSFQKITHVDTEKKIRLGHARTVLKIFCVDSQVLAAYAKDIRKTFGDGTTFEEDLRLSVRYVTDTELTPCAWNECGIEPSDAGTANVDHAFAATGLPVAAKNDKTPSLRILAFSMLMVGGKGSARAERDPVRAIGVTTSEDAVRVLVADGDDDTQLLTNFAAQVQKFDPDVIVGFQSNSIGWPYLIKRAKSRKIKLAVGRNGSEPHGSLYGHVSVAGRANLDIFDIVSGMQEVKVKTIENTARFLRTPSAENIKTIEEFEAHDLWKNETGRRALMENTRANAQALLELASATLDYSMQLSALTGMPLDQVMTAAVGFRVDSYLVRQAHKIGELIPLRVEQPFYTYRGALVLEPKTGIHDHVVVLDFASMYPTLMKEYNLSPDTLVKPGENISEDSVYVIPEVGHRFRKKPDGFYRTVLSALIEKRAEMKKEIGGIEERSTRYRVLSEREKAVKVITNACYGYAGWTGARWYTKEVAESASALGREVIQKTIEKAGSLGLEVIYGDTDSIFVTDDKAKVKQLQHWALERFKLEIKREHEYVRVLFTEAMKRYAGLLPDHTLDIVGLEVVRGDWSDIARQVQEQVLLRVLRDQSTEKAIGDVRETIRRLRKGDVALSSLAIRKALMKPIEEYKVRTPHVEAAKLLSKQGWDIGVGDKVAYVIAKGSGKLFQKARPLNQVKQEDVDIDYYVDNQVTPAAMRILKRFAVDVRQLSG